MHEIEFFSLVTARWEDSGNLIYSRNKHLHKKTRPAAVAVNLLILLCITFAYVRWEKNKRGDQQRENPIFKIKLQINRL